MHDAEPTTLYQPFSIVQWELTPIEGLPIEGLPIGVDSPPQGVQSLVGALAYQGCDSYSVDTQSGSHGLCVAMQFTSMSEVL